MKIKTAYYIESVIRIVLTALTLPMVVIGWILLTLSRPFEWVINELSCLTDKFGHYLFLKSKMAEYVKNKSYQSVLTAIKAYKLKQKLLKENPHLSENDF